MSEQILLVLTFVLALNYCRKLPYMVSIQSNLVLPYSELYNYSGFLFAGHPNVNSLTL